MKLLDRLEDRFGRFALPQLTLLLIICQITVYVLQHASGAQNQEDELLLLARLQLLPSAVLKGEVWRLVSFVAIPPQTNLLFAFFAWYLFYLMGTALEGHWGTFRYNVFLLSGYLATVAVAFLHPDQPASATFWMGSVFLAFAYLYPTFTLYLFFILPIQIRWLALLTWIGYGWVILVSPWSQRLVVLASVFNFFLFFGRDLLEQMLAGRLSMVQQASRFAMRPKEPSYYHRCLVCGITDKSHPAMDFRYCSKCAGSCCYCLDHLRNHEHLTTTS